MTEQQLIDEGYAEGKKSFEYYVKEFGENFKWENVHKVMTALNWCWYFGKDAFGQDNYGVPKLETIKNHAYARLKEAYETGNQSSTGGFTAGWEGGEMFLVFTVEEWTA